MTEDSKQTPDATPVAHGARVGTVLRRSGDKTINVQVENLIRHPIYGKFMRRRRKYAVHDPEGKAQAGDQVEIVPCRRISKNKSWRLVRIVRTPVIR